MKYSIFFNALIIFFLVILACPTNIDLGFILDSSGSLRSEYHKEKAFLKEVSKSFGIGENDTRVGVVTFSFTAEHSIKLNDHYDQDAFDTAVENIPLMGRTTRIDRALRMAQDVLFLERNGARAGVPKVLILLTDGSQTQSADMEEPADVAKEIIASGIKLLVVGIGKGVNRVELEKISGSDLDTYTADSFDTLIQGDFVQKITFGSCFGAEELLQAGKFLFKTFLH